MVSALANDLVGMMTGTRAPTGIVPPSLVRPTTRYQTMRPSGASVSKKASARVVPMRMPVSSAGSAVRYTSKLSNALRFR